MHVKTLWQFGFLQAGSEPIQFNLSGKTPLHEACQGGHWEVLELLLDYTQELDVQDRDGQSAAHIAASNGEVKCLQILSDKGVDIYEKSTSSNWLTLKVNWG